ncbi:MAG: FHA domain-containing protein [Dokdonella sp.]|nr:FHA domain-containing protein [Dokdonella sp.]MCB1569869.1 FHA domain-containing protein [Xanthomonadales bacterium]MCB1573447.1 FHA domain-containing protein [Xanthomonadales bacterium]MCB1576979.1 FHA domain-containing protein [Xanthomonadales bacterium]
MRLTFSNGEHADVIVEGGVTGIGAAQGNTIRLESGGVKPWHARLVVDQRGMILEVLDAQARTHVNARPVLEKALLRLGDVINIEDVTVLIKPDDDRIIDTRVPAEAAPGSSSEVSRVVLRGVSGAHFGKTVSVGERLLIGSGGGGLDLDEPGMSVRHASIDATEEAIHLRDLGSADGTEVNGVKVRNAVLHPGDQISFGRNRFVLEAPGYPARGQSMPTPATLAPAITQTLDAIQIAEPIRAPSTDDGGSSVWWLIAAAALIGVGIAGLLWFGNY